MLELGLEGDLGMPKVKATLRRFMSPSRTVFLTMEDLEFVRPYYSFLLKIEEMPGAKAQQRRVADKESEHPTEVVDYPPLISKKNWIKELNGVALGVQIARDYKLSNFYMYVPSFDLCNYMRGIWDRNGEGEKSGCSAIYRVTSLLRPEDMCDFEKIYSLTRNIIYDLDAIRYRGITYFKVDPVLSIFNKAAAFLANLSSEKEIKAADILENEQLSGILYEDAVL
ncbi:hypothetical protein MKW92_005888 [Papaver armeniacum]|nr:hypothetical protein MKW92_005888 [Papaver armeniacum]